MRFKRTCRGKALVLSSTKPGMRWLSMDAMLNSVPRGGRSSGQNRANTQQQTIMY
jgi:hypothetical protein